MLFHTYCIVIVWFFSYRTVYYTVIVELLYGYCNIVRWLLYGYCSVHSYCTTWLLPGYRPALGSGSVYKLVLVSEVYIAGLC